MLDEGIFVWFFVLFTLLGVSVIYGHRRIRIADPLTAFPFMISRQGKYKKRYDHVPRFEHSLPRDYNKWVHRLC